MNNAATTATWDVLREFGFEPDSAVISDVVPGLRFDFGNFKLSASVVMGKAFQPVVLFTGVLSAPRTLAEVSFEIPQGLRQEEMAAWITWNLDRVAPNRRFVPQQEAAWLDLGRQHQHLLPWEIARAERAERDAAYAARPHCSVSRSVLRLALKSLEESFAQADISESVIISFDGRVLSFECHGVASTLVGNGNAWPSQYSVPVIALRDSLPKRLMRPTVEVGIWKSMLEIDRTRCRGAGEVQQSRVKGGVR